jgi:hypothetical protein
VERAARSPRVARRQRLTARRHVGLGVVLLATSLALAGCGDSPDSALSPLPSTTPAPTPGIPLADQAPSAGLSSITASELRAHVEYLAHDSLGGRRAGSGDDERVAQYIDAELAQAALVPDEQQASRTQTFPCNAGRGYSYNVIARLPGTVYPDQPLVIGAHHDHLGRTSTSYYPGADDNASGTALLLEVAEALALVGPHPRTVIFAAFGAEELGLVGARAWVAQRFSYQDRPLIMLNADMVGHVATGGLRVLGVSPTDNLARAIETIAARHGVASPVFSAAAGGGSDHVPFVALGTPVAFFHTGTHADYHKTTDTPATLDYAGLEGTARIAYELAWDIAQVKRLPALPVPAAPTMDDWRLDHSRAPFSSAQGD